MEKKEFAFKGTILNGFLMLTLTLITLLGSITAAVYGFIELDADKTTTGVLLFGRCCDGIYFVYPSMLRIYKSRT